MSWTSSTMKFNSSIVAGVSFLASVACNASSSPAPDNPPPRPTPQPTATAQPIPEPSGQPTAIHFEGRWASAKCGQRTYERWIDLLPEGRVSGQDRVSPCPAKAVCVWSGIVTWQGEWNAKGDRAELRVTAGGGGPAVVLPKELVWDEEAKAPAEIQGDQRCVYRTRSESL